MTAPTDPISNTSRSGAPSSPELASREIAYAGYLIAPVERAPGLWRAAVRRADAAAATTASADLDTFTTSADAPSRDDAVRLAQAAIDAGMAC